MLKFFYGFFAASLSAIIVMSSVVTAVPISADAQEIKSVKSSIQSEVIRNEGGQIEGVFGRFGQLTGPTTEARALQGIEKVKDIYGINQIKGNYQIREAQNDVAGITHVKMDRIINGIKVLGQQMIVHEQNKELLGVNGFYSNLSPNLEPNQVVITSNRAKDYAVAYTGYTGELLRVPTSELIYYPDGNQAILAYRVNISCLGYQPGNWIIVVNAKDGKIIDANNEIQSAVGSGVGVLGDTKSINTLLGNNTNYLIDNKIDIINNKEIFRRIETKSFRNSENRVYPVTDVDNVFNNNDQRPAVDAHYYTGLVHDYLLHHFQWNSWDNRGSSMNSYVHFSRNYNNAFWDGNEVIFGDGDGQVFLPFSGSLDLVAHEWGHAIIQSTSRLDYKGQSGALAESFADTLAIAIENKNWLIGEDVYTPSIPNDALRSLENPTLYGQPAHMYNYVYTSSDNGGIHTNSGIPNKAFYYFATAIGSKNSAATVWFFANRYYFTSTTDFTGARLGTLQACATLYGSNSKHYKALQDAWKAVGVE